MRPPHPCRTQPIFCRSTPIFEDSHGNRAAQKSHLAIHRVIKVAASMSAALVHSGFGLDTPFSARKFLENFVVIGNKHIAVLHLFVTWRKGVKYQSGVDAID